ncbi:MAG: SRPBCC family protein [Nocardioides sp.]|uniref:SRPBCC family protein n=1 Tax=Nocardioides sp. TaxID=35761 RepID=UPI0023916879|nr:SRPBCC family protein [Nocardioides sp.]MDE0776586.1 SRPBCC family protein [Nocardioides sp.]
MHVERTFTVSRPIEDVFAYLADFENTNEWDPGTRSTTRTSGDGGLGTTHDNTSEFMGRTVDLAYETITYDVPTRVQIRGRNGRTTATDSLSFSALPDGGTSIHYRADFDFPFLIRLVAPFVVGCRLPALADETVEQIKRSLA